MMFPEADYLMFQGEPFLEDDYFQAIEQVQEAMNKVEGSICFTLQKTA